MKFKVKLKTVVGIIGVILTVVGWFISHANYLPLVYRLVTPRYVRAQAALVKLHGDEKVLNKGDRGFNEICEVIKEDLTGDKDRTITKIRTLSWGQAMLNTPEGLEPTKYLEAEIYFTTTDPITIDIRDLDRRIKRGYLDPHIFFVAAIVFWIGIGISVVALCIPDVAKKSPEVSR
jgi:hypothetical protein